MARCRMYRKLVVNERRPKVGSDGCTHRNAAGKLVMVKVPKETTTVCYNQARQFFHVTYGELNYYRKNETSYEDTFGLCNECAEGMQEVAKWMPAPNADYSRAGSVVGVRGIVKKVEIVAEPASFEGEYLERQKHRLMEEVKADFMRKMQQKNTSILSLDDWRAVFDKALEDFVVLGVQNS